MLKPPRGNHLAFIFVRAAASGVTCVANLAMVLVIQVSSEAKVTVRRFAHFTAFRESTPSGSTLAPTFKKAPVRRDAGSADSV